MKTIVNHNITIRNFLMLNHLAIHQLPIDQKLLVVTSIEEITYIHVLLCPKLASLKILTHYH